MYRNLSIIGFSISTQTASVLFLVAISYMLPPAHAFRAHTGTLLRIDQRLQPHARFTHKQDLPSVRPSGARSLRIGGTFSVCKLRVHTASEIDKVVGVNGQQRSRRFLLCPSMTSRGSQGREYKKKFSAVEETALYTAFWRCCETMRPQNALIQDPLAKSLVAQFLPAESQARLLNDANFEAARNLLACRTKFIDEIVVGWRAKLDKTTRVQIVILGAGMDTRAYRLNLGQNVQFFEADRDEGVLLWKHDLLRELSEEAGASSALSPPSIVCIGCDLSLAPLALAMQQTATDARPSSPLAALFGREEGRRSEFLDAFDPSCPTVFILEGLLEYLDPSIHKDLFYILCRALHSTTRAGEGREAGGAVGEGEGGSLGRRNLIVLQNLEPSFAESFNRNGQLPYRQLVTSAEQVRVLKEQGFTGAQIYDDGFFLKEYGRHTNLGFTIITAQC